MCLDQIQPPSFSSIYLVLLSKLNTDTTNVYHHSSESTIILSLFSILLQSNPTLPHPSPAPLSLNERTWDLIQTKTVTYMPKPASLKENDWPYLPGWWIPDGSLKRGKAPLRYWASLLFPIRSPESFLSKAESQTPALCVPGFFFGTTNQLPNHGPETYY